MQKIIEVVNLSKNFGGHVVLDNARFSIEEGSIVGLIGKSGCGKTTLLNLIVGFLKPGRGSILYKGGSIHNSKIDLNKIIGFATQEGSFYKSLTVAENLEYFGKLYALTKEEIQERTNILLNTFELTDAHHTMGGNLSIGMQKRLDIACSLIHDPEVLLLDEPTANLDPLLRKSILELIRKVNESGTTVVLSSHILEDINALCDSVLLIENKRIFSVNNPLSFGNPQPVTQRAIKLETELKEYDGLVNSLFTQGLIRNYKADTDSLILFTKDVKTTLKQINSYYSQSNDNLLKINLVKPTFEEVFESTGRPNERL